jgi:hypothetical protein
VSHSFSGASQVKILCDIIIIIITTTIIIRHQLDFDRPVSA